MHENEQEDEIPRHKLRMSFKASYEPPIATFRLDANVFGRDDGGKKEKTTLYFDVPPHHISSLQHTHDVDTAELDQDDLQHFAGGVTRVRFLLKRPGHLVLPICDLSLKPASQRVLASLKLLAATAEFVLYLPHTALSKHQLHLLEDAVTSPTSRHDRQQQDKEHQWWLGALYGGVGGRVYTVADNDYDDDTTASESGDSTVATATPPAYRRAPDDEDAEVGAAPEPDDACAADDLGGAVDSPPPYNQLETEAAQAEVKGVFVRPLVFPAPLTIASAQANNPANDCATAQNQTSGSTGSAC
jgi:hypothetical protein